METWPLLRIAADHVLPVQFEGEKGKLWKNWEVNQQGVPTAPNRTFYARATAGAMARQLQKMLGEALNPMQLLNWGWDGTKDVPLTHDYTDPTWGVISDGAKNNLAAGAPQASLAIATPGMQDYQKIQIGDVIATAAFSTGWPGDGDSHSEVITDMKSLLNGKVTPNTELYLLYNSSHDGDSPALRTHKWVKIQDLLQNTINGQDHDNNHLCYYVIRAPAFSKFNALFAVQA